VKPVIEVIVSASGDIVIDAVGFKGADCEKATRFLEEALGMRGQRRHKPEYQQSAKEASKQRIGQ
jgi:hypothetical protein